MRAAGLDHGWFPHRIMRTAKPLAMPAGKRIALLVTVPVEFFPLDQPAQPFRPSGALERPYPDIWGYAARDYGNRIGAYRFVKLFRRLGLRATAFIDGASARRYPHLMQTLAGASWEFAASGIDRAHLHTGGLDPALEAAYIREALHDVNAVAPTAVTGWQSPGHSESFHTLDLLAHHGIRYVADWVNDELPYSIATPSGAMTALPASFELSDRNILVHHDFTVDDYVEQCMAAWKWLDAEAHHSGPRVLALTVTPWVMGYPHRIRALARLLEPIAADPHVWAVTASELVASYEASLTV